MNQATPPDATVHFRAPLLQGAKMATGIRVPPEIVAALGPTRRPAVRATIAGYTYRSTVSYSNQLRFVLSIDGPGPRRRASGASPRLSARCERAAGSAGRTSRCRRSANQIRPAAWASW